jgi:hypothetical protein
MIKLKIISACDSNIKWLSDITYPTVQKYSEINNFSHEHFSIENFDRPSSWCKIPLLLNEINSNNFDYLMWIDTDAIIYNQNFNILNLIKTNKDFYLCKDLHNLNLGVFIIKCSNFSKSILQKMYSMSDYIDHVWWEQAAFIELYNSNFNKIQNNVEIVNQNILNAYDYRFYGSNESHSGHYDKNSFVIHFPALPYNLRADLIKNLL